MVVQLKNFDPAFISVTLSWQLYNRIDINHFLHGNPSFTAAAGHRHKHLKESWCSCVYFNDSSQYNNLTIILPVDWTEHRNISFHDNYPQSVQL